MAFVWFCAISALVIVVIRLYARVAELESRLASLNLEATTTPQIEELMRRVGRLEDQSVEPPAEPPAYQERPSTDFQPAVISVAAAEIALAIETPPAEETRPNMSVFADAPVFADASVTPPRPAGPAFGKRVRGFFSDDEWETLVGGSVLNKAGAVVLVIGIALFLAYSWTHMTAAGRALLSYGLSVVMLGAGIRAERKARYRTFARGLIGAGLCCGIESTCRRFLDSALVDDSRSCGALLAVEPFRGPVPAITLLDRSGCAGVFPKTR